MIYRILMILLFSTLTGCDKVYGPAIYNGTGTVVHVKAAIDDKFVELQLKPRLAFWQLKPGSEIQFIEIEGRDGKLTKAMLNDLYKKVQSPRYAVILILDEGFDVISVDAAAKMGYFRSE